MYPLTTIVQTRDKVAPLFTKQDMHNKAIDTYSVAMIAL